MILAVLRSKVVVRLACLLPASYSGSALRLAGNLHHSSSRVGCSASASCRSHSTSRPMASMSAAVADEKRVGIVWFKNSDLRLEDHEPFVLAHRDCSKVAHVFCLDERWFGSTKRGTRKMSSSRCRFLLESVTDLKTRLRAKGSDLMVQRGCPEDVIPDLATKLLGDGAGEVTLFAHTDVCSEETDVHEATKAALSKATGGGTTARVTEIWGNTLHRPSDLPFDFPGGVPAVFTDFRKIVERSCQILPPVPPPSTLRPFPTVDGAPAPSIDKPTPEHLGFDPAPKPDPKAVMHFEGGETAGLKRVRQYIWDEDRLREYKVTRNGMLGSGFSSKFSPWLALGCLSPRTIASEVRKYERERVKNDSTYWLIFELLVRDHFRYGAVKYGNSIFHLGGSRGNADKQTWRDDKGLLEAWKEGMTGYPFVDANMRELKASGFMSNRGRQIVASVFTKDLQMDWRLGAEHFEEYLLDHDPASNWGNWNYAAGVGGDPREDRYFSIVKQAKNYDAEAAYVRHWLPELAAIPTAALQTPAGITTMLRHVHAVPTSVYPDPVAPLKFPTAGRGAPAKGAGGGGNGGRGNQKRRR